MNTTRHSAALCTLILGLTACGGGGGGGPQPTPALRVLAFGASPVSTQVGQTLAPITVRLLVDGALDTSSSETVTLQVAGSGQALVGTAAKAAVGGVATFDDLRIDAPGTGLLLQASAPSFGTTLSTPFDIQAAPMVPPPVIDTVTIADPVLTIRAETNVGYTASGDPDRVTLQPGDVDLTGLSEATVEPFPRAPGATIGFDTLRTFKVHATRDNDRREYLDSERLQAIGDVDAVLEVTGMARAANGDYCVVGNFEGTVRFGFPTPQGRTLTADGIDAFLALYDRDGDLIWVKHVSGSGDQDGRAVTRRSDGSYAMTGSAGDGTAVVDAGTFAPPSIASGGSFLAVWSAQGVRQQVVQLEVLDAPASGLAIAETPDGGMVVGGQYTQGTADLGLWFQDSEGLSLARTDYRGLGNNACTGVATAVGFGTAFIGNFELDIELYSGGQPVAGTSRVSEGAGDVYVGFMDLQRRPVWNAQIGGAGDDAGFGIAMDRDGSVVVSGSFVGSATVRGAQGQATLMAAGGADDHDVFVARFDAAGTLLWARAAGGTVVPGNGVPGDESRNVTLLDDGSCLVSGYFTGSATFAAGTETSVTLTAAGGADDVDAFVARYLVDGTLAYATRVGSASGIDEAAVAIGAADGSVLLAGFAGGAFDVTTTDGPTTLAITGQQDGFVTALAPRNYGFVQARATGYESGVRYDDPAGQNNRQRALGTAPLADGGSVVCGWFEGSIQFNRGTPEEILLTSSGARDAFYMRRNKDGSVAWARKIGSAGPELAVSCAVSEDGFIAIAGVYEGGLPIASEGGVDVFVIEVDPADGALLSMQQLGGVNDDGGVLTGLFEFLDDPTIDVAYEPGRFGFTRQVWFTTTVNRSVNVRARRWVGGATGPTQVVAVGTGGFAGFVQRIPFGSSSATVQASSIVLLENPNGVDARTISVARGGAVYVGGQFWGESTLSITGSSATATIPAQSNKDFDAFMVRIAGSTILWAALRNTGEDRIDASALLPNGKVAFGGYVWQPTSSQRGVVVLLDGASMAPSGSGGTYLTNRGPVTGVAAIGGDRVAAVGYEFSGSNPFNSSFGVADTAYLTVVEPFVTPVTRWIGGIGKDRATDVTTLADGSTAVVGYVHDTGSSALPGYNPVCHFGWQMTNGESFNQNASASLRADPFWARYLLRD